MIPDFPYNIRIRLAQLKKIVAYEAETEQRQDKKKINPILIL